MFSQITPPVDTPSVWPPVTSHVPVISNATQKNTTSVVTTVASNIKPIGICKPSTSPAVVVGNKPLTTLKAHVLHQQATTVKTTQQQQQPVPIVVPPTGSAKVSLAQAAPLPLPKVTPVNPKAHILQATGAQVVSAPTQKPSPPSPLTPKAHLLQAANKQFAGAGRGLSPPTSQIGKGNPIAQQPILTGAVASPPLKTPHHGSQQPMVTGASSSRTNIPKSQVSL